MSTSLAELAVKEFLTLTEDELRTVMLDIESRIAERRFSSVNMHRYRKVADTLSLRLLSIQLRRKEQEQM